MPLLTLLSDSSSSGATTTNYALLLALTSDVPAVTSPTGTTNYALLLALTSEAGTPAPTPRRGGGTYLTQAELRRLRRQLDQKEARDRADRDRIGQTVAKAYEDIVDPPHARQARERRAQDRARQAQFDLEEEDFMNFLINNYDTLH